MRKERGIVRRKYILMILFSFVLAVALIYRYSVVIETNDRVVREKRELAALENENNLLRKQIGMETDLEKVRLLAESKLGMQKPDKDQIVYIKVPKKDHALVAVTAEQRGDGTLNPFVWLFGQAKQIYRKLLTD